MDILFKISWVLGIILIELLNNFVFEFIKKLLEIFIFVLEEEYNNF